MGWQDSQADIKSHWDENGWVAVRGFLDGGEVAGLRKEIDRYIEEVVPTVPEYEVMYDVKGQPETLKRLGHMSKYDEYFSDLIHTGKFTALAELLLERRGRSSILPAVQQARSRGRGDSRAPGLLLHPADTQRGADYVAGP